MQDCINNDKNAPVALKRFPEVTSSGVKKWNSDTFDNYKREKDLYFRFLPFN